MEYKVNRRVAKKLSDEFGWSHVDIGKLYNSTRAAVNRLFTSAYKKVDYNIEIDQVNEEEFEVISKMIEQRLYHFEENGIEVKLFNDGKGKYGFIVSNGEKNKIIFNEDFESDIRWSNIVYIIKTNRLNEFSEDEVELIEKSDEVNIMKKKHFRPYDYPIFHKLKSKRDMNEDNYVKFLGYENFVPKKIENTDDKIIKFFDDNLIDGKVYISSEEQWLRTHISRQNMSVEEFVRFYGYEQNINRDKKIKLDKNEKYSSNYIDVILEKLELEQKGKDRIRNIEKNKNLIVNRSKEIIRDLKELYKCKCQICQNKGFEEIIQKDGSVYCEAHHIKELANAKVTLEEENEVLDHYRNIIILCPYHHRYLHFNRGGEYRLKKYNEGLFLVNESDRIRIAVDYHLSRGL